MVFELSKNFEQNQSASFIEIRNHTKQFAFLQIFIRLIWPQWKSQAEIHDCVPSNQNQTNNLTKPISLAENQTSIDWFDLWSNNQDWKKIEQMGPFEQLSIKFIKACYHGSLDEVKELLISNGSSNLNQLDLNVADQNGQFGLLGAVVSFDK